MKKFILGITLLTASLGAHASMECSIKTIKTTILGNQKEKTIGSILVNDNTRNIIDSLRVASVESRPGIRNAYWLDANAVCSSESQCIFGGLIYETRLKVHFDGEEEYLYTTSTRTGVQFSKDQKQDIMIDNNGKQIIIRIECK